VDNTKRRAARFLEKEIETYRALALFFSKEENKRHLNARGRKHHGRPTYYKERMREARRLVTALRRPD
jgi:hypothetical protein